MLTAVPCLRRKGGTLTPTPSETRSADHSLAAWSLSRKTAVERRKTGQGEKRRRGKGGDGVRVCVCATERQGFGLYCFRFGFGGGQPTRSGEGRKERRSQTACCAILCYAHREGIVKGSVTLYSVYDTGNKVHSMAIAHGHLHAALRRLV